MGGGRRGGAGAGAARGGRVSHLAPAVLHGLARPATSSSMLGFRVTSDSELHPGRLGLARPEPAARSGSSQGDAQVRVADTVEGAKGGEPLTCAICLESLAPAEEARILPCLHQFHRPCIDRWLADHSICPVCKVPPRLRPCGAAAAVTGPRAGAAGRPVRGAARQPGPAPLLILLGRRGRRRVPARLRPPSRRGRCPTGAVAEASSRACPEVVRRSARRRCLDFSTVAQHGNANQQRWSMLQQHSRGRSER